MMRLGQQTRLLMVLVGRVWQRTKTVQLKFTLPLMQGLYNGINERESL